MCPQEWPLFTLHVVLPGPCGTSPRDPKQPSFACWASRCGPGFPLPLISLSPPVRWGPNMLLGLPPLACTSLVVPADGAPCGQAPGPLPAPHPGQPPLCSHGSAYAMAHKASFWMSSSVSSAPCLRDAGVSCGHRRVGLIWVHWGFAFGSLMACRHQFLL